MSGKNCRRRSANLYLTGNILPPLDEKPLPSGGPSLLPYDPSLAAGLTDLAFRLGIAATNIQLGGSIETLEALAPRFDRLQRGAVPHSELSQAVQSIRRGEEMDEGAVVDTVLTVEGRIWGSLAARSSLPEDQRERLAALVSGGGDYSALGVLEAQRWIRGPFIDGLLSREDSKRSEIKTTPLVPFQRLAEELGRPVFVKFEGRQRTGSLKVRGSTYVLTAARILGRNPQQTRIVSASLPNHALGLIEAARNLGFPNVEVVLPTSVEERKVERLRKLGASVTQAGETLEQADELARFLLGDDPSVLYIGRLDHPMFGMGLGTIGVEIDAQMTRTQNFHDYAVIAPAGSGGLLAGLGTYLETRGVAVFGAQPESFALADSLATRLVGERTSAAVKKTVAGLTVVADAVLERAMAYMDDAGFVSEGAAALPVAALVTGAFSSHLPDGLPVVLLHTGENVDIAVLDEILRRAREAREVLDRSEADTVLPQPRRITRPVPAPVFDAAGDPHFEGNPEPEKPV